MNAERLIQMLFRRVLGRWMNRGIDAGINRMAGGRGADKGGAQSPDARQTAKRAKQAARLTRRMGRF